MSFFENVLFLKVNTERPSCLNSFSLMGSAPNILLRIPIGVTITKKKTDNKIFETTVPNKCAKPSHRKAKGVNNLG